MFSNMPEKIKRKESKKNMLFACFSFLLVIPSICALFVPGFYGASDDIHIAWLFEMVRSLSAGQFPPRFVPDLSFGFGYPLFNFVFPLPFYLGSLFHFLGFSLVGSIKSVFFTSTLFSFYFMYLLVKEFSESRWTALAGAVIYVYTPYRSTDLYVRGAIGEIVAFAFFPLVLLSVQKLLKKNKNNKLWIAIGGLSFAGLITSHNISAYMFIPFVVLYIFVYLLLNKNSFASLANIFYAFVIGLFTSSFFWIPAIFESRLVKYNTVFNFYDHFPTLRQLVTPYFGYGASVPGPWDGMSFFLGGANILLVVFSLMIVCIYFKKFTSQEKVLAVFSLLSFFVSIFLMNYRSAFFWKVIPLIGYFQFPWRFLIITTFVVPLLVVFLKYVRYKKTTSWVIIAFVLVTSALYFRPQDFLGRSDSYFLDRYIPYPTVSSEYRNTSEEYLRLPKDTKMRPDDVYPVLFSDDMGLLIDSVQELSRLHYKIKASVSEGGVVSANKYLFPGWKVLIDGKKVQLFAGSPYGQIAFNIQKGNHTIEAYYSETPFRGLFDIVSLVTFCICLYLIVKSKRSKKC